ncbi:MULTISPECIES: PA14 domain-containing protein [unclassified Ruegeria]|uniref:PA14 domain-containing protein n=1 Tax=unclassified Ruegeria TaxID=2625375 RepID=UPI001491344E|nr:MULTISPECIES: PA14 domain-containing protein [unclassified Ruegeria]NOD36505.1 hypothetical protein [Ruegeria sp. HKCCD7296]NOE43744.1 hypothetical protein [Ruegeria sp. HKCCD7319]
MGKATNSGAGLTSAMSKDPSDKEAFASEVAKTGQITPQDQSRSTLHTGDHQEGSLPARGATKGAQSQSTDHGSTQVRESQNATENPKTDLLPEALVPDALQDAHVESPKATNTVLRQKDGDISGLEQKDRFSIDASESARSTPAQRAKPVELESHEGAEEPLAEIKPSDTTTPGISLGGNVVAENADGAVVGVLSLSDIGDHHSLSVSDNRFEVVDGELKLKDGISLDYEVEAQIGIEITVTDKAGFSRTENFTVQVTDTNDAVSGVTLSDASVDEAVKGAVVGTLSPQDQDEGDSHIYSVSDERFEVVDGTLKLKDGIALDHEAETQVDVLVTVTDSGGASHTEELTIDASDQNEAPTGLRLNIITDNLVQDGSFDEFDLDPGRWSTFSNNGSGPWDSQAGMEIWDNLAGTKASDGQQLLEMDAGRGVDSFSQTIQTSKGQVYDLGLDLRERLANGTDTVEVYWNDVLVAELNPDTTDWTSFDMQVIGTGEDQLELREAADENDTYGALVDNITLTATPNTIAENTSSVIVGELRFNDPDVNDIHTYTVSDDRFEVVDGVLRLKDSAALSYEDDSTVEVTVTVTDAGGSSTSETLEVNLVDTPELLISTGFQAQYFDVDHRLSSLEDIDWASEPTHQELVAEIDYKNSSHSFWEDGSRDTFGVQVSGAVQVEQSGTYRFDLSGDDGAQLVVNGKVVVENDGLHAYQTKSGEVHLDAGAHHIEVRYFENYGRAGLKLEWDGPGMNGPELVAPPDMVSAQTVSGMPIAINVAHPAADQHAVSTLALKGLPEGSVVASGHQSVVVGDNGHAEITGFGAETLSITPPFNFVGQIDVLIVMSGDGLTEISQPVSFNVDAAQIAEPSAALKGGFHAEFFDTDHRIGKLDDVNWDADPTHYEVTPNIDYDNGHGSFWEEGSTDTFAARFQGKVSVEEEGTYTFFTSADDGVVLYVNGHEVVKDDGNHGYRTESGQVALEPGTHDIELRYFENYGRAGLKLEWDGPGLDGRQPVRADQEIAVDVNETAWVAIDIGPSSEDTTVSVEGLPAATILSSGEDAMVTDGGPADLSGWNLDALEISPPPGFAGVIGGEITIDSTAFNGAPVTSTSNFAIAVGDMQSNPEADVSGETETLPDTGVAASHVGSEIAWDVALDDTDAAVQKALDGSQTDVMAEPVLVQESSDVLQISTDTYERVEW